MSSLSGAPASPLLQTIKTNLSRENDFMKESVQHLTDQMKRYENYSDIMISIKKEISNLGYQLLQKDAAAIPESKAQVPQGTGTSDPAPRRHTGAAKLPQACAGCIGVTPGLEPVPTAWHRGGRDEEGVGGKGIQPSCAPQDTTGGREKEAGRYPSTRKALGDRASPRAPKEKPLKPEKPKKENSKARAGSQPTAKPKPLAHQQTVVRGITYYKVGQVGAAEGPAGSRGESGAGQGWGAGGTPPLGWRISPCKLTDPQLVPPQRAL